MSWLEVKKLCDALTLQNGARAADLVQRHGAGTRALVAGLVAEIGSYRDKAEPDEEVLWNLYVLQRMLDLLLRGFQIEFIGKRPRHVGTPTLDCNRTALPEIDAAEMRELLPAIGLTTCSGRSRFHPFFHEVVDLEVDLALSPDAVIIEREVWPEIWLEELLVSRSGVTLRVGPSNDLSSGGVAFGCLYFAFVRLNRTTSDLSHGWGHNSQWRTSGRRDYATDGVLIYNADGRFRLNEKGSFEDDADFGSELTQGLPLSDRIDLIRHRCFVREHQADEEAWPFDDRHEEPGAR